MDTPDSARRSHHHGACGGDDKGGGRGACPRGTSGVRTCCRHSRDVLSLQGVRCWRRANELRFGGPHRGHGASALCESNTLRNKNNHSLAPMFTICPPADIRT